MSYLQNLTVRLATGIGELAEDRRQRHTSMILQKQNADGGFRGRSDESDLYYSAFALRSLAILGELHGEVAEKSCAYLETHLHGSASIIDFLSLMYGAFLVDAAAGISPFADADSGWRDSVAHALEQLRREDGGYAKGAEGRASSTYHSFLVVLCYQLLERDVPDAEALVGFIGSQAAEGGGFLEIRAGKRAGTNPTAAAIGTLQILDALDDQTREDTIDFLLEMQPEEGFRANTRIPLDDLLSTFTGLWTLDQLGAVEEVDLKAVSRYARALEQPEGGFLGAAIDPEADVEYTFYGLGTLSLLKLYHAL